jgi:hypothetical protein
MITDRSQIRLFLLKIPHTPTLTVEEEVGVG